MIKREELADKVQQEIQEMMEADLQVFTTDVNELGEEDLLNKEEELIAAMKENDEYLKTVSYQIPADCEFDNTCYVADTVGKQIAEIIELNEVEWSYTLGLYELSKFWRNKPTDIQYHTYDSTVRILGGMKYKGREQWKKILIVNKFLSTCHEDYVRDTAYMIYLSNLHNVVLDALKKFNPEVMGDEPDREA
jgi:hypothetical protein